MEPVYNNSRDLFLVSFKNKMKKEQDYLTGIRLVDVKELIFWFARILISIPGVLEKK